MIVLFTDFGANDIYVAQVKAALHQHAPSQQVIADLLHTVPNFQATPAAHLLAALKDFFPAGSVFLCIVDAGVGSERDAVIVFAHQRFFVGPDNGLLSVLAQRDSQAKFWRIRWRPENLSNTFHGRDLFAPVAAWIASGHFPADKAEDIKALAVEFEPGELAEIIYIDHYGNAVTGLRKGKVARDLQLKVKQQSLSYAETFASVKRGAGFWHENSMGLIEIAANQESAERLFGLCVGDSVTI
ncbi:MAG: SAM-dependent chlorinase/fluorinase [Burkholderiales bacterium]